MAENGSCFYVFDEFTLDTGRARLTRNGTPVSLRPKAFDALRYLVEHRGRIATKDELVGVLWPQVVVTEDSLVKCIQEVRTALHDDAHRCVKTVPRRGYLFDIEVTTSAAEPAAPAGAEPLVGAAGARKLVPLAAAGAVLLVLGVAALQDVATGPQSDELGMPAPRAGKSLAVLPFVTIGPDETDEYFSDGISEELLNVLANVPGLHVPSRTSSFTFKGTKTDLRAIGDALNVDHVLEGSVRKQGTRVRITAQLIDVATDSHLWSAVYDRELTDVFRIQDEIAENVAEALQIELFGERASGSRTEIAGAYDAYLRALHYWRTRRMEDYGLVRQSFLHAIELDPSYAAPYAGLATTLLSAQGNGLERDSAFAEAEQAIKRALELDPALASAYVARGWLARYKGDYAAADDDFRYAISLQPGLAEAHFVRVFALGGLGRFREARAELEQAIELDPLNAFYNRWMGNVQLALGDFETARAYDRRAIEIEPSQANAYAGVGDTWIMSGHLDHGVAWYLKGIARDPGHAHMTALIGEIYLSLGDRERARLWFDKAAAMYQAPGVARFFGELAPVDRPPAEPDVLLESLHEVPASHFVALGSRLFRKAALQTGDAVSIERFHRAHWPELFDARPYVDANNIGAATDVAWLLLGRGDQPAAAELLERVLRVLRDPEQRGIDPPEWSFALTEVEALALQGRSAEALAALRRAVDAGWRVEWWQAATDPTLASISGAPEFRALIERIKTDLATQLERVRAMERRGEIDGWPPGSAVAATRD
jgi:TolB-like protein/DNA-binding winged helix-turn-helix (wHTH) protein/Tfp pilus assembly protein PilF